MRHKHSFEKRLRTKGARTCLAKKKWLNADALVRDRVNATLSYRLATRDVSPKTTDGASVNVTIAAASNATTKGNTTSSALSGFRDGLNADGPSERYTSEAANGVLR